MNFAVTGTNKAHPLTKVNNPTSYEKPAKGCHIPTLKAQPSTDPEVFSRVLGPDWTEDPRYAYLKQCVQLNSNRGS